MKKINKHIFVIEPLFSESSFLRKEIKKKFKKVIFNHKFISEKKIISQIKFADAVILGLQPFNKKIIESAKKLKVIAKFGVGMDNVDIKECQKKNIKIYRATNCNAISVAETVVANAIFLLKNINQNHFLMSKKIWRQINGNDLFEKNFGVIGLGSIGKEVVKRLSGFGCKIYVNDIKINNQFCKSKKLEIKSKNFIFKNCDVITIHTPLTPLTKNLINQKTIKLMKKNAVLVNTARGGIINLNKSMNLINSKKIRIYIDVFSNEPFKINKNFDTKRNIFTPHISGTSIEAKQRIGFKNINDLESFFK